MSAKIMRMKIIKLAVILIISLSQRGSIILFLHYMYRSDLSNYSLYPVDTDSDSDTEDKLIM